MPTKEISCKGRNERHWSRHEYARQISRSSTPKTNSNHSVEWDEVTTKYRCIICDKTWTETTKENYFDHYDDRDI